MTDTPNSDSIALCDLLDDHLCQLRSVRSVLWAMATMLSNEPNERIARSTWFELRQLAQTGLQLASDFDEDVVAERERLPQAAYQ